MQPPAFPISESVPNSTPNCQLAAPHLPLPPSMQPSRLREVTSAGGDDCSSIGHASSSDESASLDRGSRSVSSVDRSVPAPWASSVSNLRPSGPSMQSISQSTVSHNYKSTIYAYSCDSRVMLLNDAPSLPSPHYYSRNSSFYSHMTREFDEVGARDEIRLGSYADEDPASSGICSLVPRRRRFRMPS